LTTRVKEVRRAIGDDGTQQRLVRNVRGRGYRFVGEVAALVGAGEMGAAESILGRADDIAAVTQWLSASPLVTLVGPGGVGKTRLGVEILTQWGAHRPDGAFFVDLAALASPEAVVPAVLRTVGLPVEGGREVEALRALGHLDALVVLDNCEHLIDAVAVAVQQMLGLTAAVRVLATSRERLGVRGERVWPVAPLDPLAARQLFLDRAHAVAPGFDAGRADVTVLDQIAEAVDRLPLAIEMAAARAGLMGVKEVAGLVSARLDLLRSPVRGTTDRHRTLAAVIAWSEELLDEDERGAFADLSVFSGPVGPADLVAVSGADAVDRVCRLVEKSLAIAEVSNGPTRYRMLQTVRGHATTCLRDADGIRRRHATWFTEVAEAADTLLRTSAEREGHETLEARLDELRAAHQWARSHALDLAARLTAALQLHAHTRLWTEPSQWAGELVGLIDDGQPLAAHVWAATANAAAHEGKFAEGILLAERALRSTDLRAVAVAFEALADIAMYQGDLARCRALGCQLRDLGEQMGDRHAVALGYVDETLALAYGGDCVGALELLGQLDRSGYAPSDLAWFHYVEGEALASDDPDRAVAAFEAAIELADGVGNRFLGGVARVSATSVHARAADPTRALHAFARLIEDWQRHGNLTHLVTSLRNLTELFVRVGAHETAGQLLGALQASQLKRSYGDEARRLADAQTSLERALGHRHLERSMALGRGRDLRWATTLALQTIEQLS
jgi:predicted ATPase